MTHPQFLRWCKRRELPPEVFETQYPHPYIVLWYECKKRSVTTGVPDYPEPDRGYLDQDADLMLAFDVLDDLQERYEQEQQKRDDIKKRAAELFQSQ